jgi:hypothetical protein
MRRTAIEGVILWKEKRRLKKRRLRVGAMGKMRKFVPTPLVGKVTKKLWKPGYLIRL